MWAFWGHLTLQKCIPICLAFLRKILFRDFFTQRIIPPPFLLVLSRRWMSYSLRLSSDFRILLWSQVSTSNTKKSVYILELEFTFIAFKFTGTRFPGIWTHGLYHIKLVSLFTLTDSLIRSYIWKFFSPRITSNM